MEWRYRKTLLCRILEQLKFSAIHDHVLIVGSYARGYENEASDIDVYVLTDYSPAAPMIKFIPAIRRWIDVEVFSSEALMRIARAIDLNPNMPDMWGAHPVASLSIIDTAYRLITGIRISEPMSPSSLATIIQPSVVQREAALVHLVIARARWQDAAGAFQFGDKNYAGFAAEDGLWHALDAAAALLGDADPSVKWRMKKVQKILGKNAWIDEAFFFLFEKRPSFDFAEERVVLLGDGIFQITARLSSGDFLDKPTRSKTTSRREFVPSGSLLTLDWSGKIVERSRIA